MIKKRLNGMFTESKHYIKNLLTTARKITVCLDGWTKKGLSCSFFGISACFFAPEMNKAIHVMLELVEIKHPHSGEMLATELRKCFKRWGIDANRVLLIVTDNGTNIVKAVQLLNEEDEETESEDEGSGIDDNLEQMENDRESANLTLTEDSENEDDENTEVEDASEEVANLEHTMAAFEESTEFIWLPCIAHSLQLVIKKCYNSYYDTIISKVRNLVGRFRKSAPAIQALIKATGKTLIGDNNTGWNSFYYMGKRLLEIKGALPDVIAKHLAVDNLLVTEWAKL